MEKEYVYLGYDGTGLFKIGITNNPGKRIRQIRTGNPTFTFLWCFESKSAAVKELEIHTHLSDKKFGGEWFDLEPEDIAYFFGNFINREEHEGRYFFDIWNDIKNKKIALDKEDLDAKIHYWKSFGKATL